MENKYKIMEKKIFLLVLSVFITANLFSQNLNNKTFDEKAEREILIGYCDINGLQEEPFDEWYNSEFDEYTPEKKILRKIKKSKINSTIKVTIVMATWCSDSRREVPHFYKILDKIKYDLKNVTLINVDTKKLAEETNVKKLNIEKVPTFIFYKNKKEIGRIIETPKETLEKDMLKILN